MIHMLKALMEKWTAYITNWVISAETESMPERKYTVTQMKNVFNMLIRTDTVKERISELKDRCTEITKTFQLG